MAEYIFWGRLAFTSISNEYIMFLFLVFLLMFFVLGRVFEKFGGLGRVEMGRKEQSMVKVEFSNATPEFDR